MFLRLETHKPKRDPEPMKNKRSMPPTQLSGTYRGLARDVELVLRLDIDGSRPLNMLSGELDQSAELQDFNYRNLWEHPFIGDDMTRTEEDTRLVLTTPIRFFRLPELAGTIEVEIESTSAMARLKLTENGSHKKQLTFTLEKTSDCFLLPDQSNRHRP